MKKLAIVFVIALVGASGCAKYNALYCRQTSECETLAQAGSIDATFVRCHPTDNFCYAGCVSNAQCQGSAWKPGLICNGTAANPGDCVAGSVNEAGADLPPTDGGADGDMNKTDTLPPDGMPPDTLKPDLLKQLGTICGNGTECISGKCTNNVCCSVASCDPCKRCNAEGKCANSDSAGNTAGDCKGSESACDGTCKAGACDFPTDDCGTVCNSTDPTARDTKICDKGTCKLTMAVACAAPPTFPPYTLCLPPSGSPPAATCAKGCTKHTDCAGGAKALCDRTNAHSDPNGLGQCVNPSDVTLINTNAALVSYLSNPTTAWARIEPIAGGLKYTSNFAVTGKTVRLAAAGAVETKPSVDGPSFTVSTGGTLILQGFSITAASGANGDGIQCRDSGSSVTVVESTVTANAVLGIDAFECDVTVRRSTISSNSAGGLSLASGTFTITNTLIDGNGKTGTAGSAIGGITFSGAGTVTFEHNTVINNLALTGTPAGVGCPSSAVKLEHSILSNNIGASTQYSLCDPTGSNLNDSCGLDGFNKPQASPCIDKSSTTLKLDRTNGPRVKGASADLGCYESK